MKCDEETCDARTEVLLELDKIKVSNLEKVKDKTIKINDDISIDMRWLKSNDKLNKSNEKLVQMLLLIQQLNLLKQFIVEKNLRKMKMYKLVNTKNMNL